MQNKMYPIHAALVAAALMTGPASGADLYVTTTVDDYDGVCDPHCSLRDAVAVANGNTDQDDIYLGEGTYELLIPGIDENSGLTGDLDIRTSMRIIGKGPTKTIIDANSIDRVLDMGLMGSLDVVLRGVTVTGGLMGTAGGGVGIYIRSNNSTISIETCVIKENYTMPLETVTGGGIYLSATNESGTTLTIKHSTIRNNSAHTGGGLYVHGSYADVTIEKSTISNNTSFDGEGSIRNTHATLVLDTSTVAYNIASTGDAGVYNAYGDVDIKGSTIAENSGAEVVAWYGDGGLVSLHRTIVDGHCFVAEAGLIDSNWFNLESPGDTCDLLPLQDKYNVPDAKIDNLNWNGGPTLTMHPQPLSPATDPTFAIVPHTCPGTDQRGMYRPWDSEVDGDLDADCDIGAVERAPGLIFNHDFECGYMTGWSNALP